MATLPIAAVRANTVTHTARWNIEVLVGSIILYPRELLLLAEYHRHGCSIERLDVEQVERLHHVERTLLVGLEMRCREMVLIGLLVAVDLHDAYLRLVCLYLIREDADDSRLLPDRLRSDIPCRCQIVLQILRIDFYLRNPDNHGLLFDLWQDFSLEDASLHDSVVRMVGFAVFWGMADGISSNGEDASQNWYYE